ncbi:MAG: UDP-N-acetylmuramoyl-tripeptide--D-alanyl-D-alanine ligase [Flavobacteriales bacterium]
MNSVKHIYDTFLKYRNIVTDSRNIEPGCIFWALKGENFNGNLFAEEAIQKGASLAVVDEFVSSDEKIIQVDDSLQMLQKLAAYHRNKIGIPIIGLTGSNGKTTSKELCRAVLSRKYKVYATKGNLNNHIGVPLTLLQIDKSYEMAIIEMGANHQGEIALLASIAQPDYAFITNIGLAHLEGFGGPEGVYKGKKELFDFIGKTNGKVFVNRMDEKVKKASEGLDVIYYGTKDDRVFVDVVSNSPFLSVQLYVEGSSILVNSSLTGEYNLGNILNAAAIGCFFGLGVDEIKEGIEAYFPDNNRSQIKKTDKNQLILDAYNANPDSMKAALLNLSKQKTEKKFFVIGDMLELGEYAPEEHRKIVNLANELGLNGVLVGQEFMKTNQQIFKSFLTAVEAEGYLKHINLIGHLILLKGSRGIKLESLTELF